ncbi:hypothetical protein CEXT_121231 [Caerostris extrusa]|uniref:Uncharacterized protein n=1 Tax=Caerostris extrusa TaxID=172846 RepID=A0AAV4Q4A5_CAEEX|nr:hypothetical protein CEXT_121231 [Caerostris extrusa]
MESGFSKRTPGESSRPGSAVINYSYLSGSKEVLSLCPSFGECPNCPPVLSYQKKKKKTGGKRITKREFVVHFKQSCISQSTVGDDLQ